MLIRPTWLKDLCTPDITLGGKLLSFVDKHCYLGVTLSHDRSDELDMKKQMKSVYARGNGLIRQFRHCSEDVKCKLFKSFCSSLYASSLWNKYTVTAVNKVKSAYNKVFRHFMKLDRYDSISTYMVKCDVDTFDMILRNLVFSLRSRLLINENTLIRVIIGCQYFYSSSIFKRWESILGKV